MAEKGWICPKCGRVYGPRWLSCQPCNNALVKAQAVERGRRVAGPAKPFRP